MIAKSELGFYKNQWAIRDASGIAADAVDAAKINAGGRVRHAYIRARNMMMRVTYREPSEGAAAILMPPCNY